MSFTVKAEEEPRSFNVFVGERYLGMAKTDGEGDFYIEDEDGDRVCSNTTFKTLRDAVRELCEFHCYGKPEGAIAVQVATFKR